MGNKVALATVATPVESYLHEVPGLVLRNTMGHGRFLKTLQCFYDNGGLVSVKAYVKASALSPASFNTSQQAYQGIVKQEAEEIAVTRERLIALRDACLSWKMPAQLLPFQQVLETDSSAVLIRQYASYSLRERLSTLPFLGHLDRVWIVYQMLQAGAQMEALGVCHGDIKVDNFVLTTANWVFLTDFVACKPVALPEDNPVDFSIFFNTSGSRTTCIAPERFTKEGAEAVPSELSHKMDVFALGCTITEFWLEGQPVFDLAQLLDYRREGGSSCPGPVRKINEPALQRLVESMLKLDPDARLTAQEYLKQWTPELFPEWFYDLWLFCGQLVAQSPDKRVETISENFRALVELLKTPHSDSSERFSRALRSGYGLADNGSPKEETKDEASPGEGDRKDSLSDNPPATVPAQTTETDLQSGPANEALGKLGTAALVTETEAFVKYNIKPLEAELAKQDENAQGKETEESTTETSTKDESAVKTEVEEDTRGNKPDTEADECEIEDDKPQEKQQLNGLSLVVPFLTSSLRSCTTASSKVTALELFVLFAQNVSEECIMQRIVPYAISMLSDPFPTVRASAVKCLDALLHAVQRVPPSEVKVFPEYIIPILQQLSTGEKEEIVLLSLMSSLASFATSAQRFLEYAQLMKQQACADNANNQTADTLMLMTQESYDREMGSLTRSFSDIIQELLTRHTINSIKFVFISIVEPLAHFFGQRRTNEVILPLFISFLNDPDWRLREAVFKHMVGLASYVGRHSLEAFILPCIQQALLDREENVVYQTVTALTRLCQLGLFHRRTLIDLAERCAPMLLHPSAWIRYGAIGVIDALSSKLDPADVYCFVLPQLKPFLRRDIMSVTQNILLQSLHPHVLRTSFEKAKSLLIGNNGDESKRRDITADSTDESTQSERPQPHTNTFFAGLLASTNLPSQEQYRLLLMEPYISAYCRQRATDGSFASDSTRSMRGFSGDLGRRTGSKSSEGDSYFHKDFPLHQLGQNEAGSKGGLGPKIVMHTGWQDAFTQSKKLEGGVGRARGAGREGEAPGQLDLGPVPANIAWRQSSDVNNANSSSVRLKGFRPRGIHIGHLSEHDGPVTVLRVSDDDLFFASGSDDGKVKIWDCARLERNVTNRARRTFCGAFGRVSGLAICEGTHSVACGYDTGSLHVFRVDHCAGAAQPYRSLSLLRQYEGFNDSIVGIENCGQGSPALLAYGLASNVLGGLDLRCRDARAFCFAGEARHGLLESFVVSPDRLWLLAGTSRGYFVVWDLRFGLPVTAWRHPAKRRVRRLAHKEGDLVVAAADNDDVMIWDVSTASVTQLLSVLPAGCEPHPFAFSPHPNPNPPMDYGADELHELQCRSDAVLAATVAQQPPPPPPLPTSQRADGSDAPTASPVAGGMRTSSPATTEARAPLAGGQAPVCTTALYCTKDTVLTGGSDCCVRLWETTFATNPPAPHSYTVCRPRSAGLAPEQYSAAVIECSVVQQATPPPPVGGIGAGIAAALSSVSVTAPGSLYPGSPAGAAAGSSAAAGMAAGSAPQAQARTLLPDTPEYHHDAILDIVAIEHPTPKILTAGRDGVIKVWK